MAREPLTKKIRFEGFKRDSFTCQYCGAKAPDVLLEIDHIQPVSKNGTSDIFNLITACKSCNAGKSNRELSDKTVFEKQHNQLSELQERKEQIEMMVEWQRELGNLDDFAVNEVANYWSELVPNSTLNEDGKKYLEKLITKFSIDMVMEAMRIAVRQYIRIDQGKPTYESMDKAINKVGGICKIRAEIKKNPEMEKVYLIKGILQKKLSYFDKVVAMGLLKKAVNLGVPSEDLKELAFEVTNWSSWRSSMESLIEDYQKPD